MPPRPRRSRIRYPLMTSEGWGVRAASSPPAAGAAAGSPSPPPSAASAAAIASTCSLRRTSRRTSQSGKGSSPSAAIHSRAAASITTAATIPERTDSSARRRWTGGRVRGNLRRPRGGEGDPAHLHGLAPAEADLVGTVGEVVELHRRLDAPPVHEGPRPGEVLDHRLPRRRAGDAEVDAAHPLARLAQARRVGGEGAVAGRAGERERGAGAAADGRLPARRDEERLAEEDPLGAAQDEPARGRGRGAR